MGSESLVNNIQNILETFLAKKSNSLIELAKKSGVPYTTLCRIQKGLGSPSLETVLGIIKICLNKQESMIFLKRFFPQYANVFSDENPSLQIATTEEIDDLSKNSLDHKIYTMAGTRSGITEDYIKNLHGEDGLKKMKDMLDKELIIKDEKGKISLPIQPDTIYYSLNPKCALNKIRRGIDFFDKKLLGTDGVLATSQSESLNHDGMEQLKKLSLEFYKKVSELKKDERFFGTIPFQINILLTILDNSDFSRGIEND